MDVPRWWLGNVFSIVELAVQLVLLSSVRLHLDCPWSRNPNWDSAYRKPFAFGYSLPTGGPDRLCMKAELVFDELCAEIYGGEIVHKAELNERARGISQEVTWLAEWLNTHHCLCWKAEQSSDEPFVELRGKNALADFVGGTGGTTLRPVKSVAGFLRMEVRCYMSIAVVFIKLCLECRRVQCEFTGSNPAGSYRETVTEAGLAMPPNKLYRLCLKAEPMSDERLCLKAELVSDELCVEIHGGKLVPKAEPNEGIAVSNVSGLANPLNRQYCLGLPAELMPDAFCVEIHGKNVLADCRGRYGWDDAATR